MNTEKVTELYGQLSPFLGDKVSKEEFINGMNDPKIRKGVYSEVIKFPGCEDITEDDFNSSLGFNKNEQSFWQSIASHNPYPQVEKRVTTVTGSEVKRPDDYEKGAESSWLNSPFYNISKEELDTQIKQLEDIDNKAMSPVYEAFEKQTGRKYNLNGENNPGDEFIFDNIFQSKKSEELRKRGYYEANSSARRAKIQKEVDELFEDNSEETKQARTRLSKLRQEKAWRSRQEGGSISELGKSLQQQKENLSKMQQDRPTDLSLNGALKYLDDAIKVYNAPSKYGESYGITNWARGLGDQLVNYDTWTAGATEMARMIHLNNIVDKLNKNEALTDSEQAKLESYMLFNAAQEARMEDISSGYNVGKGSAESIPFMAEMLITAGVGAAAKKALIKYALNTGDKVFARRMARALGEEVAEETIKRNAEKKVVDFATKEARQGIIEKGARQIASDATMTAFMPTTWTAIAEEAVDKKLRGDEFTFSDALRAFTTQTVETGIERWGGRIIDKTFAKVMPLDKIWGKTRWGKLLSNDFIQSPLGETGEEYVGAAVNYIRSFNPLYSDASNEQLRHDARQMFSVDGLTQTFLTVLPMTMLGGAANVIAHKQTINDYKKAKGDLLTILQDAGATKDEAEDIISKVESADDSRGFTARLEYSMSALKMYYQTQHPDATLDEQKAYFEKLDDAFGRYFQSAFYLNELSGEIKETIDNLDDTQKQAVQQAIDKEIGEQTRRIGNQPFKVNSQKKNIVVKDKRNKDTNATVFYSADNLVLKDNGTIDETQSENLVIKDYKGNEIKGKQREEWLEALNVTLANEQAVVQKERDLRQKQLDAAEEVKKNEDAIKKVQQDYINETVKDVVLKNGVIDTKSPKTTKQQIFVWNLLNHGQEEAIKRAALAVGENLYALDKLEDDTTTPSEEKYSAIDIANANIKAYEEAVRNSIGEQSVQQLRQDAEGYVAILMQLDMEKAQEEERKRLERIAERQRIRQENRRKAGINLDDPEDNSNISQNSESDDNTGVQPTNEGEATTSPSESTEVGLVKDRGDSGADNGAADSSSNTDEVRSEITAVDSLDNPNELEEEQEQQGEERQEPVDLTAPDVVLMTSGAGTTRQTFVFAKKATDESGNVTYISLGNPYNKSVPAFGKVLRSNWGELDKSKKMFYVKDIDGNPIACYAFTKEDLSTKKFKPGTQLNAVIASSGEMITAATSMPAAYIIGENGEEVSILKGETNRDKRIRVESVKALLDHPIFIRGKSEAKGQDEIVFTLRDLLYSGKYKGDAHIISIDDEKKTVKRSQSHPYSVALDYLHEESRKAFGADKAGEYTSDFNTQLRHLFEAWNAYCKENGLTDISDKLNKLTQSDRDLFWSARAFIGGSNLDEADKASLTVSTDVDAKQMSEYLRANPLHQLAVMLYIGSKVAPQYVSGAEFAMLPGKSGEAGKGRVKNVQPMVTKDTIEKVRERYKALKAGKVNFNADSYVSEADEITNLERFYPEVLTNEPVHNRPRITEDNEKKVRQEIQNNKLQEEAAKKAAKEATKTDEEREADQYDILKKTIEEGFSKLETALAEKNDEKIKEYTEQLNLLISGNEAAQQRLQNMLAEAMAQEVEHPVPVEPATPVVEEQPAAQEPEVTTEEPAAEPAQQAEEEVPAPEKRRKRNKKETPADQLRTMLDNVRDLKRRMDLGDREVTPSSIQEATDAIMDFISENGDTEELWNMYDAEFSVSPEQIATTERSRTIGNILLNMIGRIKGPKVHLLNSHDDVMRTLAGLLGMPEFMSVFHGSGAVFDRFDLSHVGEGEGSQAYGFGTYVSNKYGTADYYARVASKNKRLLYNGKGIKYIEDIPGLSPENVDFLEGITSSMYGDLLYGVQENDIDVVQYLVDSIKEYEGKLKKASTDENLRYQLKNLKDLYGRLKGNTLVLKANQVGYVYSVEIPDDNGKNYLDWNKPMTREEAYEFVEQFKKYYPFVNKVTGFSKEDFEEIKEKIDYNIDTYGNIKFGVLYSNLGWLISPKINNRTPILDKLASEALHKLGYTGIKVPVKNLSGGSYNVDGTNYIIFDENDLTITGREEVEYLQTPEGTIYGFAIGDEIYITPEGLNADTPIHEFTHLWVKTLRANDRKLWKKIVKELKQNKSLWEAVTKDENYKHLTSDDAIASEVLARFCGKKGAELLEQLAKGQKFGSERLEKAFINRAKRSVRTFWKWVAEKLFGWAGYKAKYSEETIDDFADMVLRDLFDGKELLTETERNAKEDERIQKEMADIKEKSIKDGTFMKAPNGQSSNLPERLWLLVRTENFKDWFGDWENDPLNASKVVDENGEPLVVYHGTNAAGFDRFHLDKDADARSGSQGFYTTDNRRVAAGYTREAWNELPADAQEAILGADPHEAIYSLFANIRNPWRIDFSDEDGNKRHWNEYPSGKWAVMGNEELGIEEGLFDSEEEANDYLSQFGGNEKPFQVMLSTDDFLRRASAAGFDGCIFTGVYDGNFTIGEDMTDYVALLPNQLKSVHNRGYFSTIDDRIEYAYTIAQLNEHDDVASKANEQSKIDNAFHEAITNPAEGLQVSKFVSEYMDMMEGMRVLQDNLAVYLRMTEGVENLPAKYDIRNMFESKDAIAMNAIRKFNATLAQELNEAVIEVQEAISKTAFYEEHKQERGGEHRAKLTPIEFVGRYLIAMNNYQRAKEGTARGMEEFYERMKMTMEEFWRGFHENVDEALLTNLWNKIKQVTDFELDVALEGQLITQEEHDRLKQKKFYVPQRGFWDEVNPENKDEELVVRRENGKAKIQLSSMQKARGGKSLAENPLVYIYRDANEAIIKSENNKVKVALYNMLLEQREWCSSPEVGIDAPASISYRMVDGVSEPQKLIDGYTEDEIRQIRQIQKRIDSVKAQLGTATGERETALLNLLSDLNEQLAAIENGKIASEFAEEDIRKIYNHKNQNEKRNTIGVLINGIQHEIVMPEKLALTAQAFNGKRNMDGVLGALRKATSFLAAQFTVNNPTFWAVNFTRDVLFVELKGGVEYGPQFNAYFTHYLYYGQGALNRYLRKGYIDESSDGEMDNLMREFIEQGGNTGLFNDLDLEKFRYNVRHLDPKAKTKGQKALGVAADVYQWATLQPIANYMNELSELTSRFAAFCAIKRMGYDTNEAVKASHNLSVNFNRRGLGNTFLNIFSSITPFVNATIQGTSGFWRTFGGKYGAMSDEKRKKMLKAGCVMAGLPMLLGCLNAILVPDDPDDVDGNVSEWDRMNYVCFPNGIRIPLPQEIRPFWDMGVNIGLLIRNQRTIGEFANSMFKSVLMNGLPIPQNISEAGTLLVDDVMGGEYHNIGQIGETLIQPSFMGTLGQIAENRNFLGGKLRFDFKDYPEYEMAPNESAFYRLLSYARYVEWGGSEVPSKHRNTDLNSWWSKMSPLTDVNPKQWKSYLFFVPSGVLDFYATITGGILAGIDEAQGDYDAHKNYLRMKDVFIANKFYKPSNKDGNRYAIKKEAKAFIDEFDNVQSNAEESAYRFGETGEQDRMVASVERFANVTNDYLAIVTRMKDDYALLQEISRQALKNQLHLNNDAELNSIIGIEAYNTLDDAEKAIVTRLNHDLRCLKDMSSNPQSIEDINVIDTTGVVWKQGRGTSTDGKELVRDVDGNVYVKENDQLRKVNVKR